jgi:hypothetical protein
MVSYFLISSGLNIFYFLPRKDKTYIYGKGANHAVLKQKSAKIRARSQHKPNTIPKSKRDKMAVSKWQVAGKDIYTVELSDAVLGFKRKKHCFGR